MPPTPTPDVLLVPHTHWDREWYHEAGRFRQRLVALVDELLEDGGEASADAPFPSDGAGAAPFLSEGAGATPFLSEGAGATPSRSEGAAAASVPTKGSGATPFLLDGQAIVLEDYLAVRPARRDALAAALRAGRLEAGPWYVLADQLIPSGEAHVRNLLAGRRILRALGAAAPPVLYSPDAFGHAAASPTLAAGFGFGLAVVWRGYGGARWPAGDAAWWTGADGSRVLLLHLPRDGYEFGSRLPVDVEGARARWAAMHAELAPRARLGFVLVQNGADHHARQEGWALAVRALRAAADPAAVHVATLRAVAERALAAAAHTALPTVAGELRDSYGYTWTLQGTFGTRAAQKRRVAIADRRLVRDVEPWLALLRLRGATGDAARSALLRAAWTPLLQCLPHDTLCGCSTDAVARAMDVRLDDADAQARGLRADALDALTGHDPVAARARRPDWRPWLVVRNRAPRPRSGIAEVSLTGFVRDVGVGPGSAGTWREVHEAPATLHPTDGTPVQLLDRTRRIDRLESPRHYPDADVVDDARALAWVAPVAGFGLLPIALGRDPMPASTRGPAHPVRAEQLRLTNGLVTVAADARGHVRFHAHALGVVLEDCLGFEDVGDAGDTYTPSPAGRPRTTLWCTGARLAHRGPLRGAIELAFRMRVPASLPEAADGFSRGSHAARGHVELPITVTLSLDADATWMRVHVRGENAARDHRLRIALRTGVADAVVRADAAFGPVVRMPVVVMPEERAMETPPPTAPLHRWVSCDGATHATTVVSDGLAEYEAREDGRLLVTLVRAVGQLSRPDLPERPGHAGWPTPTPEAQSLGAFEGAFALAVHAPWSDETAADVERLADDVLLPLVGTTTRDAVHVPRAVAGATLDGAGLAFGAMLPADDPSWVVLRCVNVGGREVRGAWTLGAAVTEARRARLDETPGEALAVERHGESRVVRFVAAAREVVTLLVR